MEEKLEKQRQQIATFIKILERYSQDDQQEIELIVRFKNKYSNEKEFKTISLSSSDSIVKLDPIINSINKEAENMFLEIVEKLRNSNSN